MVRARKVIHYRTARPSVRNNDLVRNFLAQVMPIRSINAEAFTVENAHNLALWSEYLELPDDGLGRPA